MVVDDIEDYSDADAVRAIDKRAQIVRRAIKPGGRKEIDSVVAPAEFSGKIGERHQFNDGNPEICERLQMLHGGLVCAFLCERPKVHFVDDLTLDANALPAAIAPSKFAGIDYLRKFLRSLRLKTRCRIGEGALAIHQVGIASAIANARREAAEIAVVALHQIKRSMA